MVGITAQNWYSINFNLNCGNETNIIDLKYHHPYMSQEYRVLTQFNKNPPIQTEEI